MKADELEKKIDEGFKGLQDAQEKEFEAIRQRVSEEVAEKLQPTEKWLQEVQSQVNTARTHGPGKDGLIAAIPKEYRRHIDIAERAGYDDPVHTAAKCLWWHYKFMGMMALRQPFGHTAGDYWKMADDLERAWGFDPVIKGLLGETTNTGNLVIATPIEAELLRLIRDNSIVRPLATKMVMSALTHQIPVESQNVTAYIVPENTVITDSMTNTSFAQRPLTAKTFAGLATIQNQLLQDNIIGLNDYLFTAIAEHIGILEDQGALDGGTPAVQNFSGVAVAPGVNSMAVNGTGVQGGSAPTYAELLQAVYTGAQYATRRQAAFFMLPAAFKNIAGLVDTTGQPIFSFGVVPNNIPQMLGGYPVYLVSSLSSAWTAATTSTNIYFGPPSKILFGDITGMSFDIDPYSLLDKVQTRIRVLKRTGILVPVGSYFTIMKQVKYV